MKQGTRFDIIAVAVILAWTATIYSNTLGNAFHFDDGLTILHNPAIRDITNFTSNMGNVTGSYRYLLNLSFALNYHFGELNVLGYHLANILIHIAVCILIYFVIDALVCICRLDRNVIADVDPGRLLPVFSALIFATHPINSQTVNYISARSSSLCTLFILLSLFLFIKHRERPAKEPRRYSTTVSAIYYAGSFFAFTLALGSRETAVVLPIILVACDYLFTRRLAPSPHQTNRTLESMPHRPNIFRRYVLCHIPYWGVIIFALTKVGAHDIIVPLHVNFLMACKSYLYYLKLLFLPVSMSIDHYFPISANYTRITSIAAICAVALIIAAGIAVYKKSRIISFSILIYFLALAPTSSVLLTNPGSLTTMIAEHRVYFSSAGFATVLAILIVYATNCLKNARIQTTQLIQCAVIVPILLTYSLLTVKRNRDWKDEIAVWKSAVKHHPASFKAQYNLGLVYFRKELWNESLLHYSEAAKINNNNPAVHNNIGLVYKENGKLDKAIEHFKAAIQINKDYTDARFNLAITYDGQNAYEDAMNEYRMSLDLKPDNVIALYNVGNILLKTGLPDEAAGAFKRGLNALETGDFGLPEMIDGRHSLINEQIAEKEDMLRFYLILNTGISYYRQGKISTAIPMFEEALRLGYNDNEAHYNLGWAHYKRGDYKTAIGAFKAVLTADPESAKGHHALGVTYGQAGRLEASLRELKTAVKLKPDYAKGHKNLGLLYLDYKNDTERGMRHLKTALSLDPNLELPLTKEQLLDN